MEHFFFSFTNCKCECIWYKSPAFQETTNVLNFIAELKSEMCLLKENCNILDILIYSQKAESKSSSISSSEYKPGYTHKALIDENWYGSRFEARIPCQSKMHPSGKKWVDYFEPECNSPEVLKKICNFPFMSLLQTY